MTRALFDNNDLDGLRAVSDASARLPDLCHHARYDIYVSGQYVESAGNLGSNAQHVLEFWQRRRRAHKVEARAKACSVANCAKGGL